MIKSVIKQWVIVDGQARRHQHDFEHMHREVYEKGRVVYDVHQCKLCPVRQAVRADTQETTYYRRSMA